MLKHKLVEQVERHTVLKHKLVEQVERHTVLKHKLLKITKKDTKFPFISITTCIISQIEFIICPF